MRGYFCLLVVLLVLVSLTFIDGKDKDKSSRQKERNKLKEQKRLERYEETRAKDRKAKRNGRKRLRADKMDDKDLDPNDPDLQMVLSFGVGVDGNIRTPKGTHSENSTRLLEESLDRTVETEVESEKEGKPGKQRRKRNFGPGSTNWPKGVVPYIFDDNLVANRAPFLEAIEIFNQLTCIRFKPSSSSVAAEVGHTGYVRVLNGGGCSSGVGFHGNEEHHITLAEPGCGSVSIAVHEMLHRIGQRHEQSRNDRDRYVKIIWDNIDPNYKNNFYRRLTYNLNPYDVGSVMQYGYTSFGGGKKTIELKDKNLYFLEVPGNQVLSFYDLKDLLDHYDCTAHCTSRPVCQHGGYVNVTCSCTCPEGFTGDLCQTVVTDSDCGGIISLKEASILGENKDVFITSPNYPGQAGQGKVCRWVVKAPEGYIIKMTVDDLHMAYNPDTLRCYHWLEIQYNLPGQPGIRRCGDIVGDTFLTSADSPTLMIVTMDTRFAGSRVTHKGFRLHFEKEREVCRDNPCQYGKCFPTELKACEYKCVCQPGYTGDNCDQVIADVKLKCTFERHEKCFFQNVQEGDNFEWGPGFKHTTSEGTGPEGAYRGESYLFTEMSSPRKPGDKAILQTVVPLPEKAGCLSFAYNMFGLNVNKLTLFVEGTNTAKTSLWSKQGNQGSDWLMAQVNVPATAGLKLSFEALTGDAWDSDVALDEITWEVGQCDSSKLKTCIEHGKEFEGTRDYTKNGVKCQAWVVNEPHDVPTKYAYLANQSNYCRVADEPSPWCYTTSASTRWDWCDVPYCSATECAYSANGADYTGTISYTKSGYPCQRWDSQTPHPHDYNKLDKDENYCRNTDNSPQPWCYTQDPHVRWQECEVPRCEKVERDCLMTGRGLDYVGKVSVSSSGKTCLPWTDETMIDDANYCRNPDSSSKPWCHVQGDTGPTKEYCNIPSCADSPCFPNPCKNKGQCEVAGTSYTCTCLNGFKGNNCEVEDERQEPECKRTTTGWEYLGRINVTVSGRSCQAWASQSPHTHSSSNLPENYCRNPDGEGAPWCYTTDPNKRWELCDIPDCVIPAPECLTSSDPSGLRYFGTHNVADTGDLCQAWASNTPTAHSFGNLADQFNYCRNPDGESAPWCYTVNPNVRWSKCNIPHC
ncbi:uncharacterized protein LOC134247569 [Saccostrea cucullata]|uniref:uncharacterized protein LOC134247569 n=1 Tax=Saccostrea cuccullata TaxID=36930 RepID=UPI002ED1EAEB